MKRSVHALSATIGYDIIGYLLQHPDAQDTAQGILDWWLLEQRISTASVTVQGALAELVAKQLLVACQGPDGRMFYRLNPQRQHDIAAMLNN